MKITKTLAAIALPLTLATTLVACGGEDASSASDTSSEVTSAAETSAEASSDADSGDEATTVEVDGTSISEGGDYSASIDGQPFEVSDPTTVCTDLDGDMAIAIGSTEGGADVQGISLLIGTDGTVKAVAMGSTSGKSLSYAPEAGIGEANATIDGNTYTITGSGLVADMNDPTSASFDPVPFEVNVTCG